MPDYSRSPPSRSGGISTDANTTPTQPMRMTSAGAAKAEEGATARSPNSGMATATSATAAYSSPPSGLSRVGSHTMGSSPAKVQMLPRQTINLLDTPKDTSTPTTIPGTAGEGVSGQQQQQQVPATSLLQHQPQQQRRKNGQDSDDDSDVEYVRNPFAEDD